nr:LysR substrate-binding domain-containing protein [Ramlibacter aurantiacus]
MQQLRTLIAIVRFGSLRGAARELGVSQAGLTTSLQSLEESLQARLVERTPQGVCLTEVGRQVYERAVLIERQAAQLVQEAEQARDSAIATLSVGLGPTPTALLLHRVVPDFHARFPQVRLKLQGGVYEAMESALEQGAIELAVTAIPAEGLGAGLVGVPLYRSDLVVIAREGHPLLAARSIQQLVGAEWVLMGAPGRPGGSIGRYHADQGLAAPRIAATCDSLTQLAALVRGTDWLAMVPAVLMHGSLLGAGLKVLRLREASPRYDICVVHRREPPLSAIAQAFAAMCQSCARALSLSSRVP